MAEGGLGQGVRALQDQKLSPWEGLWLFARSASAPREEQVTQHLHFSSGLGSSLRRGGLGQEGLFD